MSTHILPPGGSFFRGHHTPVILQTLVLLTLLIYLESALLTWAALTR